MIKTNSRFLEVPTADIRLTKTDEDKNVFSWLRFYSTVEIARKKFIYPKIAQVFRGGKRRMRERAKACVLIFFQPQSRSLFQKPG